MRIAVLLVLCVAGAIGTQGPVGQIYLRINQIGYRAQDPKLAIAFSTSPLPDRFEIVDAATGEEIAAGAPRAISGSWGRFTHHVELDFTAVTRPGHYRLRAGAASRAVVIGDAVYADLPDQLLEFMRQQRCGDNPWVDAICHRADGRTAYGPLPPGTPLDATGGWHDAGDQLKYLLTASNATAQMLLAYLLAPSAFADRVDERGRPGANGIPDVLDEARWGLDWMLKLHPAADQLYHQVADDRDHIGWRLPPQDTADYGWGPGGARVVYFADGRPQGLEQYQSASSGLANLAGRYAAATALGYQVWKDDARQRDYAASLLRHAKEVYALGRAHEGVQQGNSYGAPYRYEESTWADDMEWGAAELLRATGDRRYLDDATRYAGLAGSESWMGQEQTNHYQFYPFMNLGHFRLFDRVDREFRRTLADYYRQGIERSMRAAEQTPYRVGVPFIWCSNNLVVALATQSLLLERMAGARDRAFSARQRDWLLGRNPWSVSMFTGIPESGTYPTDVHLFGNAVLKRTVRGGLVDGPVRQGIFETLKGISIATPDPLEPFQDNRAVYHDTINDYATNEPTMDGTASAILLFALMR